MTLLSDKELLKKGTRTNVYHPSGEEDKVWKVLNTESPLAISLYRLENELKLCKENTAGMRKVYQKELADDKQALLMEYVPGKTWREQLSAGPWKIESFLLWANRAAYALQCIHEQGIIHQEITPDHIIANATSGEAVFIGFGGAILQQDIAPLQEQETSKFQEENLAYLAPEQTGRTQQKVSYATDLYALGAVFFQVLTGTPLFNMEDPLEIIHAHIAKAPTPPHQIRTDVPVPLSNLILKLLNKDPKARYASAADLQHDLALFYDQWSTTGKLHTPATPTQGGELIQLPDLLYGREQEQAVLHKVYEQVSNGAVAFHMVSGPSGVSKSSLIRSLRTAVQQNSGNFIEGKFDPYQKDIPYLALVQALRQLVAVLLTSDEEKLNYWKQRISQAMGNVGKVLTDIVPDLVWIVGEQPALPHLEGAEAQNRFVFAFKKFIAAIAAPEHPLVFMIDDLQWADVDSLNLLESLDGDARVSHFMMVGAFRTETIADDHPVSEKLDDWKNGSGSLLELTIDNYSEPTVQQYLQATFQSKINDEAAFFQKIFHKTKGNPLYLKLLIGALLQQKIVAFDGGNNTWQWEPEAIDRLNLSDSTLDLMAARIKHLHANVQQLLSTAACQGNQFDTAVVQRVMHLSSPDFNEQIETAITEGIVLKDNDRSDWYLFAHDGLRQIAYNRLSEAEKHQMHLKIGQLLLDQRDNKDQSDHIFDVLLQLNQCHELIEADDFKIKVAALNLTAGKKARDSAAFGSAYNYMKEGIDLLGATAWSNHYTLTLESHIQAVELAALTGNYEAMDRFTNKVTEKSKTLLDQEQVVKVRIHALIAQKKLDEAIATGVSYLEQLGHKFPTNPGKGHVLRGLLSMKVKLMGKKTDELGQLPAMENKEALAAIRILSVTAVAAYFGSPNLTPLLIFKTLQLCLKHGIDSETAFAFSSFGFILAGALRDYEQGHAFGELSNTILEGKNRDDIYVVQKFIHNIFTRHWKAPTREIIEVMEWTYHKGIEVGNFEYAAYGVGSWAYFSFYLGVDLLHLDEKLSGFMDGVAQMNQPTTLPRIGMYQQAVQNLLGKTSDPIALQGEVYKEEEMLPIHLEDNIGIVLHNYYFLKTFMAFFLGNIELAEKCAVETDKHEEAAMASYFIPLFDYLKALVLLASPSAQKNLSKVNKLLKKMKKYAAHGPNYIHQYALVQAEKARVMGKSAEARILYEDAIFQARKVGNLLDEAMAWELGGKFYVANNRPGPAAIFIRQAHELYANWGAIAKTRQMEVVYAQYLNANDSNISGLSSASNVVSTERIEFLSLVKTLQTLSTEIELSRLLEKMMGIVIENAGAERGLLVIEKGGEWEIIAEKDVNNTSITQERKVLTESNTLVPTGIIHYIIRSHETLVLNNVSSDTRFADLPYFKTRPVKSIMGIPLVKQNRLIGVIYLENTLSAGTFTPRIQEGLNMLSSQLAISLENALLYEGLEQKVKERTQEVMRQKGEIEEQAVELREKNDQLLQLSEYKKTMTSMIVHDLKNPLNSIVNVSKTGSIEAQSQMIRQSGQMMLNMVMNILDVSKYEESKMALSLNARNLKELAQNSIDQVDFLAIQKQITLNNFIDEGVEVFADIEIMQRVIVNLLTNAIKYTPINGSVTLSAEPFEEGFIRLNVTDTGQGIKEKDIDFVFKKFGQVDQRRSGDLRSTGLGLTFCKMAVEAHGGHIGVESEWGQGATFWLFIREGENSGFVGKTGREAQKMKEREVAIDDEARTYLQPFAHAITDIPVYKITQLRKVIDTIDTNYNNDTEVWCKALEFAIKTSDQEQFDRLIQLVKA